MEDTRNSPHLVHVLRHSFRPSEHLDQTLQKAITSSPETPRSFITIKSLSMLALDAVDVSNFKYSQELVDARRDVELQRSQWFELHQDIQVSRIGERALAVLMGVRNKANLFKFQQRAARQLPDSVFLRDPGDPNFSLYARLEFPANISEGQLIDTRQHLQESFQAETNRHLLEVSPLGLPGFDQYRNVVPKRSTKGTAW